MQDEIGRDERLQGLLRRDIVIVDVGKRILAEIASDTTIDARGISVDESRRESLNKKKILRVRGTVMSGAQKTRILKLVQERAGEDYEVMDDLFVSELLWEG